jgi:hypothetical protein
VHIVESRLTRLSYAPEIAQAMLRQQQASAVVGARQRIVEGAVGMVQLALQRLQEEGVVEPDEERKATMVSKAMTSQGDVMARMRAWASALQRQHDHVAAFVNPEPGSSLRWV